MGVITLLPYRPRYTQPQRYT